MTTRLFINPFLIHEGGLADECVCVHAQCLFAPIKNSYCGFVVCLIYSYPFFPPAGSALHYTRATCMCVIRKCTNIPCAYTM